MKSLIGMMVVLGSLNAFAQGGMEAHPCKEIKAKCEAAGFKVGDHKDKKGLYKDCMQPIMSGQTVAGVSVTAEEINSCKTKHAEQKAKK